MIYEDYLVTKNQPNAHAIIFEFRNHAQEMIRRCKRFSVDDDNQIFSLTSVCCKIMNEKFQRQVLDSICSVGMINDDKIEYFRNLTTLFPNKNILNELTKQLQYYENEAILNALKIIQISDIKCELPKLSRFEDLNVSLPAMILLKMQKNDHLNPSAEVQEDLVDIYNNKCGNITELLLDLFKKLQILEKYNLDKLNTANIDNLSKDDSAIYWNILECFELIRGQSHVKILLFFLKTPDIWPFIYKEAKRIEKLK